MRSAKFMDTTSYIQVLGKGCRDQEEQDIDVEDTIWEAAQPGPNIQARARQVRYRM